jgi:aminopeptidase N
MRSMRLLAACALASLFVPLALAQHNKRLPRVYDLQNVEWHLSFDETLGTIDGDVTNTVVPLKAATREIYFDSSKLSIKQVTVNGSAAKFRTDEPNELLYVTLPKPSGPTDKLDVRIIYGGRPEAGIYFIPAKRAFPAHTSVVYTQGEMIDQHYWLPTWDNPGDKTTWDSYLTVPSNYTVIMNGREVDEKPAGNGTKVVHYRMDKPMSTYLISIIAGQYVTGNDGTFGKTKVRWNVPVGLEEMGKNAFAGTDKMIAFYSKQTGFAYPYPKFEQSAVPDYMFGGMENITAVTQTIDAIFPDDAKPNEDSEGLVLHELAHQWFGDTITCQDWSHAWLNEGWATFMPSFYMRYAHGQDAYDLSRYGTLQGGKFGGAGIPIVWTGYEEPIDEFFVDNIYAGGASRMFWLMHTLGEAKFWHAIKNYLNEYKYKPVTTPEFFASISKSTGVNLNQFMKEWFYTAGVPHITVKRDGKDLLIDQKAPIFTLPLDVWVWNGTDWSKKHVMSNKAETRLPLGDLAGKPVLVDPEVFLAGYITYAFPISISEQLAMYHHAPNAAAKARLQETMLTKLSPEQTLALCKEEKDQELWERLIGGVKDEAYLLEILGGADAKKVAIVASNPGSVPLTPALSAKLQDLAANDPHVIVRQSAIRSLLSSGKNDELAAKAWAMPSYNEGFRNTAMFYYVRTDPDKAREMALNVLANPDSEALRRTCISVLGGLKDKPGEHRVYDALIKVVEERSFGARNDAINALATYGDKAALPHLIPLESNSMVFTRRAAKAAVQQLGGS